MGGAGRVGRVTPKLLSRHDRDQLGGWTDRLWAISSLIRSVRNTDIKSRSTMTERRLNQRSRRRPDRSIGALVALPGVALAHTASLSHIALLANKPPGAGIGLIAAIGVSVTIGIALIAYLVRPLLVKLITTQPTEPAPREDAHGERWARWEEGAAGAPPAVKSSAEAQAEDEAMFRPAMATGVAPDQTTFASGGEIESRIIAGITTTVSILLDCANEGAMLSGFGLYTDRFFQKFAEESGLSLEDFISRFQDSGVRAPEERLRVARMEDVTTLPDGRISARVVYSPLGALPPERYIFSWSPDRSRWLIDDISSEE